MANCAVFASGTGSNYVKLQEAFNLQNRHSIRCLVCDRTAAAVIPKAIGFGTTVVPMIYRKNAEGKLDRHSAEEHVISILRLLEVDCIILAGFMRIISPLLLDAFPGRIVNIHPSLLPRYPGSRGIEESIASTDPELGISIHLVDSGVDTGPIITQKSFVRIPGDSFETEKEKIHQLEHTWYPKTVLKFLEKTGQTRT
ncbi:phosphoribosylglycinamide formyltransferase [Spirochaeta dissipatitropha]